MGEICPGLNLSKNVTNNLPPLRVAFSKVCTFFRPKIFKILIDKLKMPYIVKQYDSYGTKMNGQWTGIIGELVANRSDFTPSVAALNYDRYQAMEFSPTIGYRNSFSILSGRLFANNENGLTVFTSFTMELWITIVLTFVIIAIIDVILQSNNNFLKIISIFSKLLFVFINQSSQFSIICCYKHLFLRSIVIISIFMISIFFSSEILSKLVFQPQIIIDTLDDLVHFIEVNPDVEIVSDNASYTWKNLIQWNDNRAKFLLGKLKHIPVTRFDYKQVYRGKTIIICFDTTFENIIKDNPHLKFHLSSERLFGNKYGVTYTKSIHPSIKSVIDITFRALFESGIHNYNDERQFSKILYFVEEDLPTVIKLSYFGNIISFYIYQDIGLILVLLVEILGNRKREKSEGTL